MTNQKFAKAKITKVVQKRFRDMSESDKQGHEKYKNDDEMYAEYTKNYKVPVNADTPLKVIWLELKPDSSE